MASLRDAFINLIFPAKCRLCANLIREGRNPFICRNCWGKIEFIKNYPTAKIQAIGKYAGALKTAIHLLKYEGKRSLANPLGNLLINHMEKNGGLEKIDFIVPVPLHKKRLREREFNQSLLLARLVGKHFHKPILESNLMRMRMTIPQVELDQKERLKNMQGAFRVKSPEAFKGKNILLIDDVRTTGATVKECYKMLKQAGAKEIHILTLAI